MSDLDNIDENLKVVLDTLCPEMKEAFLSLAKHFHSCEKCRTILAGYGAPSYVRALNIVQQQEMSLLRLSSGLNHVFNLLDIIAEGNNQNESI